MILLNWLAGYVQLIFMKIILTGQLNGSYFLNLFWVKIGLFKIIFFLNLKIKNYIKKHFILVSVFIIFVRMLFFIC